MRSPAAARGRRRLWAVLIVAALLACGCTDDTSKAGPKPGPPTPSATGECGTLKIAYDPSNGYEASAFIVGTLAAEQLDCTVDYVKTTARQAWHLVADGRADVYLDAYGSDDLRARLTGAGKPVTVIGPNGIRGGVDLLAPDFMAQDGLTSAPDLADVRKIGWGLTSPAITTVPALLPLAQAFLDFQQLDDYVVRDYDQLSGASGMAGLLQQAGDDDSRSVPNLYLAEGPRLLLGDRPGQASVQIPASASGPCTPDGRTTLCRLTDFRYQKIVNSSFAASGSPAYSLVYHYQLGSEDAGTILELVELSGFDVGEPDVASWLNTHQATWRRWLS